MLRFEAVCHNTKALGTGRVLDSFPDIVARLAGMLERFCTTLDCVDVTFVPDGILDQLPRPSVIGKTHVGGVDLAKPRTRTALAAVGALSAAPDGFSVSDLADKVHAMTGDPGVHHSSSRLRPTQVPGPRARHQARARPPLPRPAPGSPHHHRAPRPA